MWNRGAGDTTAFLNLAVVCNFVHCVVKVAVNFQAVSVCLLMAFKISLTCACPQPHHFLLVFCVLKKPLAIRPFLIFEFGKILKTNLNLIET